MANEYDDILPPLSSEDKMMAGSCYPFWPVVPLFVLLSSKRQDPFLAFHAVQALAVGLTTSTLSVVGLFLLWVTYSSLPTSWMMTSGAIGAVLMLAAMAFGGFCFLASIFLGWQASSGRFLRVAGLGDLCEARMASLLGLSATQLRQLAVDRELALEEKVTVLAPIATPEQMQAEMDRWAQPQAQAQTWWGKSQPAQAQVQAQATEVDWQPEPEPVRQAQPPQQPRPAAQPEVKPWRPAAAQSPAPPQPATRPSSGEVKPWRPAPAQPTPAARPVSFPSVAREAPEEKKKWWTPKEG
ncbi:MAG: hypothetical protein KF760_17265 [Candidatus Eremiobacteraeota bacterium]|nr:hypothetical protein [Candidatus Eremiobacteraeota bacterium]MCW5869050.1 hypothetical protein [Candidatus Eremiobacteraeota bacterium]